MTTDPPTLPSRRRPRSTTLALLAVLALAASLRAVNFPHRYEVRDMDETGYMDGGLVLFEGITPGIRVAPAAPQTWITWAYAAAKSAVALARPEPATAALPLAVRPAVVIDHTLFDAYQDMSGLHRLLLVVSATAGVVGAWGGFRLGAAYGGVWGGVLVGGLVATLPLFVDFAAMTRPYSDAWSLSIAALGSAAAARGWRRWVQTGVFLALATGSRIDMLAVVPLVAWLFWDNPEAGAGWRPAAKALMLGGVLLLLIAPWLTISPLGVLRTIATTRGTPLAAPAGNPRVATFVDLAWGQGLGPAVLVGALPLVPLSGGRRARVLVLAALVGLLALSMFAGPYVPLRYHGGPIVGLILLAAVGAGAAIRRCAAVPWAAPVAVAVLLLLPTVQVVRQLAARRSSWTPEQATAWVEQHVPAGTRVYDQVVWDLRPPLPTPAAADAAWDEVTDQQAWRRKFQRGLSRFGPGVASVLPRAMSEDNLVLDRGLWRRYFILGADRQPDRPRYDLRPFGMGSQVFGVQDLPERLKSEGGVVIWREPLPPPAALGTPVMQWVRPDGTGTFVFCSPDVRAKLNR
jgi:hypothetical protein